MGLLTATELYISLQLRTLQCSCLSGYIDALCEENAKAVLKLHA